MIQSKKKRISIEKDSTDHEKKKINLDLRNIKYKKLLNQIK